MCSTMQIGEYLLNCILTMTKYMGLGKFENFDIMKYKYNGKGLLTNCARQNFAMYVLYAIPHRKEYGNDIVYLSIFYVLNKQGLIVWYLCSWEKGGFSYQFSPTPDIQSNGYANGSNDTTQRQTSVRRKQQYDGGWVAGKTHQGNYKHQ